MWPFRRKAKIGGLIAHYRLEDWWVGKLSEADRATLTDVLGGPTSVRTIPATITDGGDLQIGRHVDATLPFTLTTGRVDREQYRSVVGFLTWLAEGARKAKDRELAGRIFDFARGMVSRETDVIDVHFLYHAEIEASRKDEARRERAARDQIAISDAAAKALLAGLEPDLPLPAHSGYWALAELLRKRGQLDAAEQIISEGRGKGWVC